MNFLEKIVDFCTTKQIWIFLGLIVLTTFFVSIGGVMKPNNLFYQVDKYREIDISGFMVFVSVAAAISNKGKEISISVGLLFFSGFIFFMAYLLSLIFPSSDDLVQVIVLCALFYSGLFGVFIFGTLAIAESM